MMAAWAVLLLLSPLARSAATFEDSVVQGFETLQEDDAPEASSADLPARVDLSHMWADGPRDQAPRLSCHAFAAVGLLEAGLYRATGRHARLSEADLFARATSLRGLRSAVIRENGLLREDLAIGLRSGVVPGDWWAAFNERLPDFGRFEPMKGKERGLETLLPEAATGEAKAARERTRLELRALELRGESFLRFAGTAVREIVKGGAVACRVKAKRRDRIMRRLAAGVPLGAGILLNGVSDPNLNAKRDEVGGQHYVILTGYERRPAGVVFTMRNSWGKRPGWDAVLTEDDLCALFALTWVEAPADRR